MLASHRSIQQVITGVLKSNGSLEGENGEGEEDGRKKGRKQKEKGKGSRKGEEED